MFFQKPEPKKDCNVDSVIFRNIFTLLGFNELLLIFIYQNTSFSKTAVV